MSFTVSTTPTTPEAQTLSNANNHSNSNNNSYNNINISSSQQQQQQNYYGNNNNNNNNFDGNSNNYDYNQNNNNNNNNNNGTVPHHYGVSGHNTNAHPMRGQMGLPDVENLSQEARQLLQALRQFRQDMNLSIEAQLRYLNETKANAAQKLNTIKQNIIQRAQHQHQQQQQQNNNSNNTNDNIDSNALPVWSNPAPANNNNNSGALIGTPPNSPALDPNIKTTTTISNQQQQHIISLAESNQNSPSTALNDASQASNTPSVADSNFSAMVGSPAQREFIGLDQLLQGLMPQGAPQVNILQSGGGAGGESSGSNSNSNNNSGSRNHNNNNNNKNGNNNHNNNNGEEDNNNNNADAEDHQQSSASSSSLAHSNSASGLGSNADGKGYNLFSPQPAKPPLDGGNVSRAADKNSPNINMMSSSSQEEGRHRSQSSSQSPSHEEIINRLLRENSPEEAARYHRGLISGDLLSTSSGNNTNINNYRQNNGNRNQYGGGDDNDQEEEEEEVETDVETDVTASSCDDASSSISSDADGATGAGAGKEKKKRTVRKVVKKKKLVMVKKNSAMNSTGNPITSSSAEALRLLQETRLRDEQQQQQQQQQQQVPDPSTTSSSSAAATSASSSSHHHHQHQHQQVADDSVESISVERLVKLYGHKTGEHRVLVGYHEGRPIIQTVPGTQPDTPKSLGDIDVDPRKLPCQAIVQFKNNRLLQVPFPFFVAPGDYVFIDIDRGRDLGVVIFVATSVLSPTGGKQLLAGLRNARLGKVVGVASSASKGIGIGTDEDGKTWRAFGELEVKAVQIASQLATEQLVPLSFVDAEYQFDRSKLTVYYPRETPKTDFRELVKKMYKQFKARIWLEPMNENMSLLKQ